jgi:hypothetical protein
MAINNKNKGRLRNERTRGPTMNLHSAMTFPCNDDKSPISRRGFKDAIRGVEWRKAPLVGFPTGAMNGVDVLDIDPDGMGWYALKFGAIPETRRHETPRGVHLLFRHAEGLRCSTTRIVPDVHVRAEGGYVIWWPRQGLEVDDYPLADMPLWLLELARKPVRADGRNPRSSYEGASRRGGIGDGVEVAGLVDALRQIDPRDVGKGHYDEWFALAGACKARGIPRDEFVEWCLRDEAYAGDREETERIWESAYGEHGGAFYKALSERGIPTPANVLTPRVPPQSSQGNSWGRRTFNWRSRTSTVISILHGNQIERALFSTACVCAEVSAECGKPSLEFAQRWLEDACPKLIREIGLDAVRRCIRRAFEHIAHKLKERRE